MEGGRHGGHLENLFFASSSKPKSQLTTNLVGSIWVTYISKIAKTVPMGNTSWYHDGRLENQFFFSSSELKGQLTRNLAGSIWKTCRSNIAKIVQIGNQRWLLGSRLENLFFASSPILKKPIDSKLGRKHRVDLRTYVKNS